MDRTKKTELVPGMRIGRWTLLTRAEEQKWLCRCECGTVRDVPESSLQYGISQSCGCHRKELAGAANAFDMTGMQFGELTVTQRLENDSSGAARWLCRCSCGADIAVLGTHLLNGRQRSCTGRNHQKNYTYKDITGQRFGSLMALYPSGRHMKDGPVLWRFRCGCGKELDLLPESIAVSGQSSCGCGTPPPLPQGQKTTSSRKLPVNNSTGYRGVYVFNGKYLAKIVFQKKQYLLGSYDSIEDAAKARAEAEALLIDAVAAHRKKWKHYAAKHPEWAKENPIQILVNKENEKLQVTMHPEIPGISY